MINLSPSVWYIKLFLWTQFAWKKFWGYYRAVDKSSWYEYHGFDWDPHKEIDTNLCQLARTLLLWFPLYVAVWLVPLALVYYVLIKYPLMFLGGDGYLDMLGFVVIMVIALCVSVIVGFFLLFVIGKRARDWLGNFFESLLDRALQRASDANDRRNARHAAGEYTMWETFKRYVQDLHDGICSMIVIGVPRTKTKESE